MLENDSAQSHPHEVKGANEPGGVVEKPRRKRRKVTVKKQLFAGLWPKIAVVAIILCLALAGFIVSLLTRTTGNIIVPIIEDISISDVSDSSAVITWKTNEPATSQVTVCDSDNCTSTREDKALVTNHTVSLTDIKPNTRYQLTILSKNDRGSEARIRLELNLNTKTTIVVGSEIGDLAPDFTVPAVDGRQLTLSEYRGKAVMVNFWETTCPSCQEETKYIQAVYDSWPDDKLQILAVSVAERAQFVQSFMDSRDLTFTALLDTDEAVKNLYHVTSFPTTFFINSEGIIKAIKHGRFDSQSDIETMLKSL